MNGSKHQRRSHRAKAHVWANGAHERMVQYGRQNGQPLARGSANWMQMLQYMAFVALKGGRGLCYMSVERIAGHAANTDRTVQRMTALAEASGVLILVEAGGRRRGNRRRANCWRINPQCMSAPPPRRSSRTEKGQLVAGSRVVCLPPRSESERHSLPRAPSSSGPCGLRSLRDRRSAQPTCSRGLGRP